MTSYTRASYEILLENVSLSSTNDVKYSKKRKGKNE